MIRGCDHKGLRIVYFAAACARGESDAQTLCLRRWPNNDELLFRRVVCRKRLHESGMRVRPSANISQAHKYSRSLSFSLGTISDVWMRWRVGLTGLYSIT